MGEYASLKVWKKLDNAKGSIYDRIYALKAQGLEENAAYKQMNLDFWEFGRVEYHTFNEEVYYSRVPNNFREQMKYMLEWKYDIPVSWLTCFTFSEFNVFSSGGNKVDPDFGIFNAQANAKEAYRRLSTIPYFVLSENENQHVVEEFKRLETLLISCDNDDIITVSSEMIYFSPDGEFGVNYVKRLINEKITEMRQLLSIPHWSKRQSAKEA